MVDAQRRRVLLALAGVPAAALAVAGCTAPAGKRRSPDQRTDTDTPVRWAAVRWERALLETYALFRDTYPDATDNDAARLVDHHRAHLAALIDTGPLPAFAPTEPRPAGTPEGDGPPALPALVAEAVEAETLPDDANAARALVDTAERAASAAHVEGCTGAHGTVLAALLASLGAAHAVHGGVAPADLPAVDSLADAEPPSPEADGLLDAAQAALAGEHACIYGYGVVGAHLDGERYDAARRDLAVHEERRGQLRRLLLAAGAEPAAALPAYTLPFPVEDGKTARELAGVLEERLMAVYVDVIGAGAGPGIREFSADAVVDAAVRAAGWGAAATAFPGLTGRPGAPDPETESSDGD